jgi:hypothetical protein
MPKPYASALCLSPMPKPYASALSLSPMRKRRYRTLVLNLRKGILSGRRAHVYHVSAGARLLDRARHRCCRRQCPRVPVEPLR